MSVRPEIKLPILIVILGVILAVMRTVYVYSNSIPLIQMNLTQDEKAKLTSIGSVKLSKAGYLNINCKIYNSYEYSYVMVSSGTKRTEKYAKWSCGHTLKHVDCPEIDVKIVNGHAEIDAGLTQKEDYSLGQVKKCAALAIRHAPTELRPTSDDVIEENLKAENLKSYS